MSLPSLQVAFLRRLIAQRYPDRRKTGIAEALVAAHSIGRVEGAKVLYGPTDYLAAANMLRTRNYSVEVPLPGFFRSEAPPGGSEKVGANLVSKDMVAVLPICFGAPLLQGTRFLAMTRQDAAQLPHEVILLCENLETLMRLGEYSWLAHYLKGRATLAVFRGAPGYFRTDAPAALLRDLSCPVLGFFDFDPKGLCMAASTPRLEALCLPPWPDLERAARALRRDNLFTNQYHACRAQLDALPAGPLAAAWAQMKAASLSLNQEGFPR